MDFDEFDQKFMELVREVSEKTVKAGLYDAGAAILNYADDEDPQTPYKHGDLRASRQIEPHVETDRVVITIGYNIIYAARLHEGEPFWNWTRTRIPSPGPKFLESAMAAHAQEAMQICADYIQAKIDGIRNRENLQK